MLPVRCFTCGGLMMQKSNPRRTCCRALLQSHVDALDHSVTLDNKRVMQFTYKRTDESLNNRATPSEH